MATIRAPRIAITPCSPVKLQDYVESVRQAGGDPWVLDLDQDAVAAVLDRADGILLTGGGDVHPSNYSTTPHPAFSPAEPGRDDYELALVRLAEEADTPLLAICRGVQVLNVSRGGTLFQHLPDERPSPTPHVVSDTLTTGAHDVSIVEGSLLSRLLPAGHDSRTVNSRHHQAARTIGHGLTIAATAPDGIVEALEDPSRRFCLGVQWHPENFWRTARFRPLFDAFIRAATP